MSTKLTQNLVAAIVSACFAISVAASPISAAFAAGPGGNGQPKGESAKKPGEDCEQMKKDSKDYKACVTKQAQSDKKSKGGKKQNTE